LSFSLTLSGSEYENECSLEADEKADEKEDEES
jgi:hypothetical protein